MKLFKYVILILLVCNIPSVVLFSYGASMGSLLSYITTALLLFFYLINKKHQFAWPFVIFAVSYFLISGVVEVPDEKYFYIDFIKYVILIICGGELARKTSIVELYIILLIAALSILVNAVAFPLDYGRYSGFFLDPNSAGFACLLGIALSFAIKNNTLKYIGLSICTFCGALTFSRTFFLLWLIMLLISVFQNKNNIKIFVGGFAAILLLLSVATSLKLNPERLSILDSLVDDGQVSQSIDEDSRTETWALYYDKIYESPFVGNGYKSFMSDYIYDVGVHNNYLRVFGDAGFFPFLVFLGTYLFMFFKSLQNFKTKPYQLLLALSLLTLGLTNHNFDTLYHVTIVSLWLYFKITITDDPDSIDNNEEELELNSTSI
ncbi:O-antigen ligase family protein [Psychroserpens ponticola]|uniref:O-antigen ligase family protein n=1 Tax=Psychroserpens ponticola TaxID=2932268 RepID=A0ABY7S125_9FLAO|nr:O-antigen ligase family protein [Psychroserpens ponticola]WCO03101.1 O-antigen ligase family protein [Psychroserpens ponticola]